MNWTQGTFIAPVLFERDVKAWKSYYLFYDNQHWTEYYQNSHSIKKLNISWLSRSLSSIDKCHPFYIDSSEVSSFAPFHFPFCHATHSMQSTSLNREAKKQNRIRLRDRLSVDFVLDTAAVLGKVRGEGWCSGAKRMISAIDDMKTKWWLEKQLKIILVSFILAS